MNEDLLALRPHPSKAISDAALGIPDLINLSIGEASFGAPRKILDALRNAVSTEQEDARSFDRYANSRGTPALREAIAQRYERLYGVRVDPATEVLVTGSPCSA